MRIFLLTLFWISNIGNIFQLLIMASAGWSITSGDYSFSELTLELYVTQVTPWLSWIETVMVALLGDLGRAILSIPIFILSPLKFIAGVLIGWWAYTTLKTMPSEHAQ